METSLGRKLPAAQPIGESWEIVDRPEAQSIVEGGPLNAQSLRAVYLNSPEPTDIEKSPNSRAGPWRRAA